MKTFLHVQDIGPLNVALAEAAEIKADRYKYEHLGHHKTALLIFFNNSLRTRLSTQKAARNLGLDVMDDMNDMNTENVEYFSVAGVKTDAKAPGVYLKKYTTRSGKVVTQKISK